MVTLEVRAEKEKNNFGREREKKVKGSPPSSVTRLNEISTLCQHFKSLWPFLEGLLSFGHNVYNLLWQFVCFGLNFRCCISTI